MFSIDGTKLKSEWLNGTASLSTDKYVIDKSETNVVTVDTSLGVSFKVIFFQSICLPLKYWTAPRS